MSPMKILLLRSLHAAHSDRKSLVMEAAACCRGPSSSSFLRKVRGFLAFGIPNHYHSFTAEKALATLQSRPIPGLQAPVPLVLSPYPPTNPPTPLPPPSAIPRLVKHLPLGYTDSQLYDIFRPYGALASARTHTHFGPDTGMVEFWNEDDARSAEDAMHCADVEGQNIAVQVYQQRRTSGGVGEFNTAAPTFIPSGSMYTYSPQVRRVILVRGYMLIPCSTLPLPRLIASLTALEAPLRLFPSYTVLVSRFNWLLCPDQDLAVIVA